MLEAERPVRMGKPSQTLQKWVSRNWLVLYSKNSTGISPSLSDEKRFPRVMAKPDRLGFPPSWTDWYSNADDFKIFCRSTAMRWSCLKRQEHGWKSAWGWTSARKSPRLWIWNMHIPIFWDSESRFIKAREINMWSYHILHPKHWTG